MLFGLGNKRFTTVDIGFHAVKAATFKHQNNTLKIMAIDHEKLPPDTIQDGKIMDKAIVSNRLEEIFRRSNYNPRKIITTISNDKLITRNIELPAMKEEELDEALKWELEEILPYSVENTIYDYIISDQNEEKIKLLLIAEKKEIIDNFSQPLTKLGYSPDVINVQPLALISLLKYQNLIQGPTAVIDLGAEKTKVVLGDQKQIYLSRTIDNGGIDFTRSIMEVEAVDFREAEERKIERGIQSQKINHDMEEDISLLGFGNELVNIAREIADEINRSLEFYSIKNRGESISRVFITGGTCSLRGIRNIIEDEIGFSPQLIDPFTNFKLETDIGQVNPHIYSIVLALAASEVLHNEG